jgi:hypothetical protein
MLSFRIINVKFPPFSGGPQRMLTSVRFPSRVRTAEACIRGFYAKFTDADHHYHQLEVFLSEQVGVDGREVGFSVYFALSDFSHPFDDKYEGEIEVLVIADLIDDVTNETRIERPHISERS